MISGHTFAARNQHTLKRKNMKKIITVIAVYMGLATSLYAQGKLGIGIRVNPEFSNIINKNDADAGRDVDLENHFTYLSFGVGALYNINKNVGIGLDILFSREGQAFSGRFDGSSFDDGAYSSTVLKQMLLNNKEEEGDYVALAELNYIKLPIMLSLTTDNTRPAFFTMLVGPQVNFLYNVAQEVNEVDYEYPHSDITPKDLYRPVTLGGMIALGGGYNLTSHLVLSARIRIDYGFNDAENKDAMVSYFGTDPVRYYSNDRKPANTLTKGLMIGMDFKF